MTLLRTLAPLALLVSLPLCAQTYKAKRILFKNPGSFTQAQLEKAAGIHPGDSFNAAELTAAAQRLSDSGYFDAVSGSLDGTAAATDVHLDLKPVPIAEMLHAGFENFVWLSRDEIETAIKAQFPLFIDYLPENSPEADAIDAQLTQSLAAKGISAKVQYETVEPTLEHPERALEFRILQPSIIVTNVSLSGVSTSIAPLVQKSVNATTRTPYNDGLAGTLTSSLILAPLLDAGYVEATLNGLNLAPSAGQSGAVAVVLSASLQSGAVYHVSTITFAGSPLVSPAQFAATQKLHPGDVASRKALLDSLAPIDTAYRRQGYMDVVVTSNPVLDTAQHQVAYTVTVQPGEPYLVHDVKALNLDPAAQAEFDRGFRMKAGTVYNPDYLQDFIKNNTALQALAKYKGGYKVYADPNTHTVDLVLTFFGTTR